MIPHFKNWIVWFVDVYFPEYCIYFRNEPSIRHGVDKNLIPLCKLPFYPIDNGLGLTEAFQFHDVPFIDVSS